MKKSDLISFLESQQSGTEFSRLIAGDVATYRSGISNKGSTPTVLSGDESFEIEDHHVRKLCQAYLDGELDSISIHFVADAILLSTDLGISENGGNVLESLGDPEISPPLSKDRMKELVDELAV